jgi:hypothetical protein
MRHCNPIDAKCDGCGKPFIYTGGNGHYNRTKKHYCSYECTYQYSNVTHGLTIHKTKDRRYKIWSYVGKRAKQKGVYFDLELKDIPEIPEYCPILGIKIISNDGISAPLDSSPSLDRIDCKRGYTKDNIRIISNRANRFKSDATLKELELIYNDLKSLFYNKMIVDNQIK